MKKVMTLISRIWNEKPKLNKIIIILLIIMMIILIAMIMYWR